MKSFSKPVAACCVALSLALSGLAAAQTGSDKEAGELVRGSQVVGAKLFDKQGEHIGEINDVLFDENSGGMTHGVLAVGGFLGIGEKLSVVPWRYLRKSAKDRHEYVVEMDKAKLTGGENVDRNRWPDLNDEWMTRTYQYYGITVKRAVKLVQLSKVVGAELYDQQGKKIGSISDLLMSPSSGAIGFGVASLPADRRGNRDLTAIPWKLIRQSKQPTPGYVLNVEEAKLKQAVFFDKDHWPAYNDVDWGARLSKYWGTVRDWWKYEVF